MASAAGTCCSAGAAGAASAGGLTALALASWEGTGTDAVLVTNRSRMESIVLLLVHQDSYWHQHLQHVQRHNKSTCCAQCTAAGPGLSDWPKLRLTESGTDLITILRCDLSFKTIVTA